jgi:hypothetical protein
MSVVGVTIAATTKITRMEYRTFRHIQRAVTTRIRARKKMRSGISKMRPRPTMTVKNSFVYSPICDHGLKALTVADQEIQRRWVDHPVTKEASGEK